MFRSKAILVRKKRPYSSKYDDNCLCIIFSNTFEIVGRREIGLSFSNSCGSPLTIFCREIVYSFLNNNFINILESKS